MYQERDHSPNMFDNIVLARVVESTKPFLYRGWLQARGAE
eukprot:gene10771-biopygen8978